MLAIIAFLFFIFQNSVKVNISHIVKKIIVSFVEYLLKTVKKKYIYFLFGKDIVSTFHLHYFTKNSLIDQRQTLLTRGVFHTAEDRFDLDPEVLGTFLEGVTDDVDDFTWSDVPFCVSVRRFAAI